MLRALHLLLLLLSALAAVPAAAHKASDSYLSLRIEGGRVEGSWDIALRDLDLALGLDGDGNGEITWGELRARHAAIATYALERLRIASDTAPCPTRVLAHLVDEHTDGAYAVLRFEAACPGPVAVVDVSYALLFELDAQHRGLLRLEGLGPTRTAVFARDTASKQFTRDGAGNAGGFRDFVRDGVRHIAIGWDHILFLVALLLPAVLVREGGSWKPAGSLGVTLRNVVGIVTAFTVAHSITLSLGAFDVVRVPSRIVESLIAASVVATALDNVVRFLPRRRWLVAFAFGLLHGLGFASVLLDMQLPRSSLAWSLFGFNLGVEIGQLVLVAILVPLAHAARNRPAYPRYAVNAGSAVIAVVAVGWCVERALDLSFMPF